MSQQSETIELQLHVWNSDVVFYQQMGFLYIKAAAFIDYNQNLEVF